MATEIYLNTFRWRNDDGSESSATWIAANNTNPTSTAVSGSTNLAIRVRFEFSAGSVESGLIYSLTYSHNSESYIAVTSTSEYLQGRVSSNLTDGANTTEQMGESGTFVSVPGVVNNTSAVQSTAFNSSASTVFEVEFSLVIIAAAIADGDTLALQVVQNNGLLVQPAPGTIQLTISKTAGSSARRRASVSMAR